MIHPMLTIRNQKICTFVISEMKQTPPQPPTKEDWIALGIQVLGGGLIIFGVWYYIDDKDNWWISLGILVAGSVLIGLGSLLEKVENE